MLGEITTEQRKEYLEKARAARVLKKEAGKNLRQTFADEGAWREMASRVGFRLAPSYTPSSETKYIRKVLKKLDKDSLWFSEVTGFTKYTEFYDKNPDWPCWVLQSLLIESYLSEGQKE